VRSSDVHKGTLEPSGSAAVGSQYHSHAPSSRSRTVRRECTSALNGLDRT
jgi:hypothetical protein